MRLGTGCETPVTRSLLSDAGPQGSRGRAQSSLPPGILGSLARGWGLWGGSQGQLNTLTSGSMQARMGVGRPSLLLPDIAGGLGMALWGAGLDAAEGRRLDRLTSCEPRGCNS